MVKGEVRDEQGQLVKNAHRGDRSTWTPADGPRSSKWTMPTGRYATVVRLKPGSDVIMTVKKEDHVFDIAQLLSIEDTVRAGSCHRWT
jgi:hypothetical protein